MNKPEFVQLEKLLLPIAVGKMKDNLPYRQSQVEISTPPIQYFGPISVILKHRLVEKSL
jgi:hypothetical protein